MPEISVLLSDVYRASRAYAIPITSHALQIYQSVLATGPRCKLLDSMRTGQTVTPRLVSQRAWGWSPVLQVFEGHISAVISISCSPDGTNIRGGHDGTISAIWTSMQHRFVVDLAYADRLRIVPHRDHPP
jgi:WD40 repeat protein